MVLCAVVVGFLIGEIGLKHLIARERPFVVNPSVVPFIKAPSGYSFPSGHSCSSFAAATASSTVANIQPALPCGREAETAAGAFTGAADAGAAPPARAEEVSRMILSISC